MPAHVTYPGVYVVEESSGAQAVAAVSTSTALFVGMVDRGPFGVPTRVLSLVEYERVFGAASSGEMDEQARQFYVNGGTEAWIMRIANGAVPAAITLKNEANTGTGTLALTARDVGVAGNLIRAAVDYDTASPERTFNLTVYRSILKPDGTFDKADVESHANLSMDPGSARYAPNMVNGASQLVTVTDLNAPAAITGLSIGGIVHANDAGVNDAFGPISGAFRISIGNRPPVEVVVDKAATAANIYADIGAKIASAYLTLGMSVSATASGVPDAAAALGGKFLQIESTAGAVVITPAATNDVTAKLMLGTAAGGVEMDSTSPTRPAPSGLTSTTGMTGPIGIGWLSAVTAFAALHRNVVPRFTITDPNGAYQTPATPPFIITATPAASAIHSNASPPPVGSLANVRQALDQIAAALGAVNTSRWSAKRAGLRIVLTPKFGGGDAGLSTTVTNTGAPNLHTAGHIFHTGTIQNVAAYSLGQEGGVPRPGKQINTAADVGSDGTQPTVADYQAAFGKIDTELDSFNILMLPRTETQTDTDRHSLWGIASALAAKKRAILLVDPDRSWNSIASAEAGVKALKTGVETRNAAVFWPRLRVPDPTIAAGKTVDPSGSIAGLMARTDTRFGVWTAPAGIEATIRGIVGIDKNMSDDENGVLNPLALNAIRQFPSGVVAWGARTMVGSDDTGNIDDKYIPVRRTMLFIEESLYRGLKFAVFRPNAEPLWASIRLAAGSFMNGLMRQGAFASRNKLEAYYVICDATTTTATDINLGIVNVVVAFAPLKPAEFVVLTVKQIAGQVEI